MAKKLFVGSLPFSTTDKQLEEFFSQIGNVMSATVIMDKFSGRSKGFGFVEMTTEEEAARAIQELNGKDFGGRNIIVNEARPMENRGDRGGNRGGYTPRQ